MFENGTQRQMLTRDEMINVFRRGEKHSPLKGIGIERECFLYRDDTGKRLLYPEIKALLEEYLNIDHPFSVEPVSEKNYLIGALLTHENIHSSYVQDEQSHSKQSYPMRYRQSSISLEPGGQFELSMRVHNNLCDAFAELQDFDNTLNRLLKEHHYIRRDLGFEPIWTQNDLSWMPKERYVIMRNHMPKVGGHGLDMMGRTCTLQLNLDYENEQNMADMMFVAHMLTPLVGAIFAASPFYEGNLSSYKSYRHYVWQDTDPARCGLIPAAFKLEEGRPAMTYGDYVDYLLSVPMYFINRNGYKDYAGKSFLDFIKGAFDVEVGRATIEDFYDHMTVAFPEVRLKTFLEIRCVDASPIAFSAAAFFLGLLYDASVLNETIGYIRDDLQWTRDGVMEQYKTFPREGLGETEWAIAKVFFDLSKEGLRNRGLGEEQYLDDLEEIITTQKTYSDRLVERGIQSLTR